MFKGAKLTEKVDLLSSRESSDKTTSWARGVFQYSIRALF